MNPLKLFRKFIKMVRGGAAPWQIFVSCLLGVIIGMIPGFNALVLVSLVIFALVNLSMGLMLIGVVIGKALCLALAPVTLEIGYVIIHSIGLEGVFAAAFRTPFVALMDLDVYCLVGGLPLAIVVGSVLGWLIARAIKLVRIGSIAAGAKSLKVQKISSNFIVRILLRILFGKQKKSMAEMLAARHPVIRKSGVVLLAIIVGLVVVLELVFLDRIAQSALVGGLETGVGAEVNVKTVDLSLTGGRFDLEGLQITDPDKPTHNMIQIDKLTADLNIADLLTGRLVVEEIVIGEMNSGVEREKPGQVYREPQRPEPPESDFSLSDYFEHKDRVLEYLAKVRDYLENQDKQRKTSAERTPEETRQRVDEMAKNRGYLKVSAKSLLSERPTVTIRHIKIEKLPIPNIGQCVVEANEISDNLALNEKPMSLSAKSDTGFDASALIDFVNAGAMHKLAVTAPDIPVKAMGITDKCPLDISEAMADVKLDGQFNRNKLAFPIMLQLHGMKSAVRGKRSVLGLDPATADRMFKNVTKLKVAADIRGPVASPQVHVDMGKTLAGLKESLVEAGKAELANMAADQLKKVLPGGLPVPGLTTTQPGDIIKGAGDLLKGKTPTTNPLDALKGVTDLIPKKDDDKDKQPTTKPKDPVGGLLDGLRL